MTTKRKSAAGGRTSRPRGSASVYVQHERWMADRWKVMFRAGEMRFAIGAECDTRAGADRLRADFEKALTAIGVKLPNAPQQGRRSRTLPAVVGGSE